VLWIGTSDCPVCHRTLSGAPGPYKCQLATLGKTKARSDIIHRTVRCASGATAICANGRLWQQEQCNTVPRRSQSRKLEGHRTVRCRKRTKLQRSTQLRTLMVGWRGCVPDKEQCLSGGAPDCPVRPSPAASPTATKGVGGYKYPQPPQPWASKFSKDHIQYKSSSIHSKTLYKRSKPLQVPNSFQTLSGLWERDFCVHSSSCRLDCLSSFPILILKCFVSEARDTKCAVVPAGS
jgi:hypothetical protein